MPTPRGHCSKRGRPGQDPDTGHSGPIALAAPIWAGVTVLPLPSNTLEPSRVSPLRIICQSGGQAIPRVVTAGLLTPEASPSPVSTGSPTLFQCGLVPVIQCSVSNPLR